MEDSTVKAYQVVSRLIDYLNINNEKINWDKFCWQDGRVYRGDNLVGKLERSFTQSKYSAEIGVLSDINLDYNINWDNGQSWFGMKFSKFAMIGLKPQPNEIILFNTDKLIFQAKYSGWGSEVKEAAIAIQDFADNGHRLVGYFENMQEVVVTEYLNLVEKFKHFRENPEAFIQLSSLTIPANSLLNETFFKS